MRTVDGIALFVLFAACGIGFHNFMLRFDLTPEQRFRVRVIWIPTIALGLVGLVILGEAIASRV